MNNIAFCKASIGLLRQVTCDHDEWDLHLNLISFHSPTARVTRGNNSTFLSRLTSCSLSVMVIKTFRDLQRHNLETFRRQPLAEISGSLGDLGTFLPIVIALTVNESISLPTTLISTGIFNILTGLFFGIPLPVQPMKAIAAVAIANNF